MTEFQYLSTLRADQLSECFRQRGDDLRFLGALNEELKRRCGEDAIELQMRVATAILKARRAGITVSKDCAVSAPASKAAAQKTDVLNQDWLSAYLSQRGLARPNGNPLFRYRMTDPEYEAARAFLNRVASSGLLENGNERTAAVFVACCAEWFRREATSTFRKWEALVPGILTAVPESCRDLTKRGLKFWNRSLEESIRGREFLLTLALEGGFPVKILREGARSWLRDYLRALIRRGLAGGVQTVSALEEIADEEGWLVRKSYRNEDFLTLCSELAMAIIQLRRLADSETIAGVANTIILDKLRPNWRQELPIYVPPEDQQVADILLEGLIDEKIGVLSANGLEVRRYLLKRDGQWIAAVQVLADGEVPTSDLRSLSTEARARAVPAGELGTHMPGELALFEPPSEKRGKWRVRPFSRVPRLLADYSFFAPVYVTLTSPASTPQRMTWPKGESLRSDLLVFQEDEASTAAEPLLRYWRSGSVSSRSKALYVLFPAGWQVEGGEGLEDFGALAGQEKKLIKITGVAYFGTNEAGSPRYRVATGEEQSDRELHLKTVEAGFALTDEQLQLVQAGSYVAISEGIRKPREIAPGEIFIRRPNGWQELRGPLAGQGKVELSWRDSKADILLERRQLVLLPPGANISGAMKNALGGEVVLEQLDGWSISAHLPDCETRLQGARLSFTFNRRPLYRLPLTLRAPGGESFDIVVPLKGRDGILALANGAVVQPRTHLDPARLRGGVISTPREQTVEISCREAKWASARMRVDGELPLGSLREAVEDMFAVLPSQDDELELDFIGDTRPAIKIGRYRYKQPLVDASARISWVGLDKSNVRPVARMILDPRHEHALEPQAPSFWRIPERCTGPCLVYLRDSVDVLSRPMPLACPHRPGSSGPLASALVTPDARTRKEQVVAALQGLAAANCDAGEFKWLLDAATGLNGLPPNALDALKFLPDTPVSLIRLLFQASAEQRPTIWSLQNALPFLWLSLPAAAWGAALQLEFDALEQLLRLALGERGSVSATVGRLQVLRDELIGFEPGLEVAFGLTNLPATNATRLLPLNELTGAYVRGQLEREVEATNDLASILADAGISIPPEILNKSHIHFSGLFAPVILAAVAQGKLKFSTDLNLLARRTMREDPIYVSQAYRHLLKVSA